MKNNFKEVLHTDGSGYWSRQKRTVQCTRLEFGYGLELRLYFDKRSWDVNKHGLIYTDDLFLEEFKAKLRERGLSDDIDYSEQGMQGDDYVSFDMGEKFAASLLDRRLKP